MGDKAGVWFRVSTRGQSEENQVPQVMRWVSDHGYEVEKTYRLKGRSAYKGEQAETLAQALDDMRKGVISVLVVWKCDRIERRGPRHVFDLVGKVQDAGGRIEFVTETYLNDLNAAGEMMLASLAIMAREESRQKSDRVNIGLDAARENGAATNRAPWGLRVTGPRRAKQFVPAADGRKWVPQIFANVAGGASLTTVAYWLNTEKVGSKKWSATTVGALIRNSAYMGLVRDGSGTIVHRCEALVLADVWQRANDALSNPERRRRGPNQPKAMLAGVAKCGECGASVYRTAAEKGRATRYYRCSASHGLMVPTALVEATVEYILVCTLEDIEVTEDRLIPGRNWGAEIERVKFEIRHLDMDAPEYDERHTELRGQLAGLKARPSVPDRWERVGTGVSLAAEYEETPGHERAAWLKRRGFTVKIWKDRVRVDLDGQELMTSPLTPVEVVPVS